MATVVSRTPGVYPGGPCRRTVGLLLAGLLLPVALSVPGASTDAGAPDTPSGPEERSILEPRAEKSLLLDGSYVEGRAVVVGERGHVLLSDDQGRTWRQVEAPTRATLTGVRFLDRNLGWAVGHDATILRTRDGGERWERVYSDPEGETPLLDVWISDPDHGMAVGAYGLYLVTSDGGSSWEQRTVLEYDDFHLNHIARSESGRFYIAAEAGTIYRSDDDGQTWVSLPSPYEGSFFGTLPLDGDTVLVFGLRGHLYRSEDAGENWQQIETGTEATLNRGLRSRDGTVIIAGHEGTLLLSDDGGRTFTRRGFPDREAYAKVLETDDGGLILIGEFGVNRMDDDEVSTREP